MEALALVTGAGGFVGQAIVLRLIADGYHVRALDLPNNEAITNFSSSLNAKQKGSITFISGDVTNPQDIANAMIGVSLVFHTAALLNSIAPLSTFESVNVGGTKNACEAAVSAGVERFVLISTSDVFGIPASNEIITEETPYRAWGEPYADTKIRACEVVKDYQQKGLLNTTIIYPGWVYGPGDRQFFPAIIDMVKDRHAFTWHKKQPSSIDLIFINDLVSAIITAAESKNAIGEDYLILDDNTDITPKKFFLFIANKLKVDLRVHQIPYPIMYSIAWIGQLLKQKGMIKEHLLSTTDVKAFGNDFHFSTKKAEKELNWKPAITSDEGLTIALDWQLASTAK